MIPMVASSADKAVDNARETTSNDVGMCLWYTQEWLEAPHAYPDATTQWKNCKTKHAGDTNPPKGAPVFWTGGSHGYGHAAISVGGGKVRSIDQQSSGRTSEVPISEINRDWGLPYGGWSEDIGNASIPWLSAGGTSPGEDGLFGMSELGQWTRGKDITVKGDDQWHLLPIDDDDNFSLVTGDANYMLFAAYQLQKLAVGATAQFRFCRVFDYPDDTPTTVEANYPIHETTGTTGDTFDDFTYMSHVGDNAPGNGKEKIRLYGKAPSGADMVVAKIVSRCFRD